MSNLIAIAYPDPETAEKVRTTLVQAMKEHLIELDDAVVVTMSEDRKIKLHQAFSTTGAGAASGALWGGLIGLLFLSPLLGAAIGAGAGAAGGAATDIGIDDKFLKELGAKLTPGSAALIALVSSSTPEKVLPRITEFGGHVMQSSLSSEAEARLEEALSRPTTAA